MTIFEKDKTYVAGTYNRFPVAIKSGKGSILTGEDGREYIDLTSGIGVTAFGIADEKWQAAVIEQIGKVQHTSNLFYTAPCADLAELLCKKTGMKKVFFSNSGTEANECAIKAARKYASDKYGDDRYTVVTMKNSFHGRTLTTLAATGQDHYHELYRPLTPGFASITPNAGTDELDALHEKTPVAAVMIECVQGEGGVLPLEPDFIRAVSAWCKKTDACLIVDEVQTGNGRTGKLYAYMNYGIEPDIVSTAKGLAGGLPLGATLLGEKVENVLGFGDHGSTFGGNPVSCAAALSILSRIDGELLDGVKRKSDFLRAAFRNAKGIESVSGMGLLLGLKTKKPASEVLAACRDRGVLCLSAKDKVRLAPALNIPDELLARAADVIKAVCAE
ncbi:MAG: aminotransferase class III-fold pyridoxal phosphate-dependent enzyme [Clostridia bacterium]|nr:aminotransferase class III-fold pyridoxal phosphate-dependent enzyme [Clostridia bacterium]